jgi:hypothetical protein
MRFWLSPRSTWKRTTATSEKTQLQFRAEAFNALNNFWFGAAQFNSSSGSSSSAPSSNLLRVVVSHELSAGVKVFVVMTWAPLSEAGVCDRFVAYIL